MMTAARLHVIIMTISHSDNRCQSMLKRFKFLLISGIVSVLIITYLYNYEEESHRDMDAMDISCHLIKVDHHLPSIHDDKLKPQNGSIFFHETACRSIDVEPINPREACAVESAAKMNPNKEVYLLVSSPALWHKPRNSILKALHQYNNIKVLWVNLFTYSYNTPVMKILRDGSLHRSQYRVSHASDLLRYLTLYKLGGIYLDLDVIVAKSFDDLGADWAARESDRSVSAGAIAMSHTSLGRQLSLEAIMDIGSNFRGDLWGNNGPGVVTRILKKNCATSVISHMNSSNCKGFAVYGPELFYPIGYQDWKVFFDREKVDYVKNMTKPYIFHFWNKFSIKGKTSPDIEVPYTYLAKKYCPLVYEKTKKYF